MTEKQQHERDVATVRDYLWTKRVAVSEWLVLHACETHEAHAAMLRLVGWTPDAFLVADLLDAREILDA
jgi:hypothetical protein